MKLFHAASIHEQNVASAGAVCSLQLDIDIACKETAERQWARALNYFSLEGATTTGGLRHSTIERVPNHALDIHHHLPSNSRISAPSTLSHIHHQQHTLDPFRLASWSFTSNHHPIQWHPLPLLRRRRAAISKMRNHAMPVRNGTSTHSSEGLFKGHLLVMRSSSPSPSPSHPTRRTTRDVNICANHLDL